MTAGSQSLQAFVWSSFDLPPIGDVFTWEAQARVWGQRVFDAIKCEFPDGGPDIVEFPDYEGDGCVTIQAARTRDASLRNTQVVVRLHTTVEMTSVLNGHVGRSDHFRKVCDYERYSLEFADRILWPGGDVLGTYARFYGAATLAPATKVRHAILPRLSEWSWDRGVASDRGDDLLRLIYLGRLERRKGVQNLVRAATSIERDDWSLTLVGPDTNTGPLGVSVREQLRLMAAEDPRIAFRDVIPFGGSVELFSQHDVGIVPSLWECWGYVALECLAANRPMVATPVGGLAEIVSEGISGLAGSRHLARCSRRDDRDCARAARQGSRALYGRRTTGAVGRTERRASDPERLRSAGRNGQAYPESTLYGFAAKRCRWS